MFETVRLKIAEIEEKDIESIHQMNCYPEVREFNTIDLPESVMDTKMQLLRVLEDRQNDYRRHWGWTIRLKSSNEFVGEVGMNRGNHRFKIAEIYYSLLPKYWGNGYATEAVKVILGYAFLQVQLHRIEAGVAKHNQSSIRLLEKVGMIREGLRRKILPIEGKWQDSYLYAILEEDWAF